LIWKRYAALIVNAYLFNAARAQTKACVTVMDWRVRDVRDRRVWVRSRKIPASGSAYAQFVSVNSRKMSSKIRDSTSTGRSRIPRIRRRHIINLHLIPVNYIRSGTDMRRSMSNRRRLNTTTKRNLDDVDRASSAARYKVRKVKRGAAISSAVRCSDNREQACVRCAANSSPVSA
jgi:hypothetical protein